MRTRKVARYYNSNGIAVAIVAVATYFDNQLFDWAAYIGGSTRVEHLEDTVREVAEYGAKLSPEDATYFFPDFPQNLYRS